MAKCGVDIRARKYISSDSAVQQLRTHSNWLWHMDEVFVKINGETHYL